MSESSDGDKKIMASISALEAQRATLGDAVVDPAIAALRHQLSAATAKKRTEDERKLVTILFVDISGFTALSETLDAEDVRRLINACFNHLAPILQKYGGTIDKFIGDEIMALFGAPVAHEDDPERALRAALEMMEGIEPFNRTHGTKLGLHIGINSGGVVAGSVGTQDRLDYSVMGDAVNLAARLEDASPTGSIFVGPNTHRKTAHLFEFEKLLPLTLQGKEAPVEVHRLIRAKTTTASGRGIQGLRSVLVGRDTELGRFNAAVGSLENGRGSICAVFGEAGVGKSRLVTEARAASGQKYHWAEGRALSYTTGMSYWLARAVIRDLLEIDSDNPDAAQIKLKRAVESEFGNKFADTYPYLARLLEVQLEQPMQERVKFLSSEALQGRILQAFRDYIRARTNRRPLVLVWEDMHWADPSSLEVFESLVSLTIETPLLLICIARPDENLATDLLKRIGDSPGASYQSIELQPLTREQSRSLIEQLLKIDNHRMRDLILDRAEGNPFFLEEIIRSLLDAGVLVQEGDRLVSTREIVAMDVPETLQSTLMTRLDRLKPEVKHTLQRASVIGRTFDYPVLARLHDNGETLNEFLSELRRREFIRLSENRTLDQVDDEYVFKHAITHEVAYNSMLLEHRKHLHKLVAETIEEFSVGRLDELSPTLGRHFERAQEHDRAAKYLGRAAEHAKATFANTEAIDFYESALHAIERVLQTNDNAEHRRTAARLNEGLGDLFTLIGEHDEARGAFNRALELISNDETVSCGRIHRKIGFSYSLQRNYLATDESLAAADRALEELLTERDAAWWEEKVQIQLERMHLLYWQGKANEMQQLAERYRPVIQKSATPIQRGRFFEKLALSHLTGSRYHPTEQCVELGRLAVSESRGATELADIARIQFVLGLIYFWGHDFVRAIEQFGNTMQLVERCGDIVTKLRCLTYLGGAHRCAGDIGQARSYSAATSELAAKLSMVEYIAMAKANLAWVAWREGDESNAELLGHEALKLWHGMDDPYGFDWMALFPLIATALAQKKTEDAVKLAEGLFGDNQHPIDEELATATRAAIDLWKEGDKSRATSQMEKAIAIANRHHYL
jgi:class 3 adenylate cyclase/tetratricopeptide (TPR) repeat protein